MSKIYVYWKRQYKTCISTSISICIYSNGLIVSSTLPFCCLWTWSWHSSYHIYIYIMIIYTTLQICHSNPQNIKHFDHRTPDQPFALNSSWVALVCWADPSSIKCQSSTMAPGQSNWWNINDTAILQHQGIDLEVSGIPFITILSKLFVLMLKAQK